MIINDGPVTLSAYVVHGDMIEIAIRNDFSETSITIHALLDRREAERLLSELQEFIERTKNG